VDLELSEEQKLLQKSVREFAESEVRRWRKSWMRPAFPARTFQESSGTGLTGVAFPESEGGAALTTSRTPL